MFTDAPVMTTQVVSRKTFKSVADGLVLGVAAIGIAERGAVMMRVRRSAERSLLITCVLGLTLIVGSPSPVRAVIVSFDYTATLFDPYGTIPSGDTLTGSFSYNTDSGTGLGIPGISVNVNHATAGSLSSTNVSINVFNDGFGGTRIICP